MLSIDALPQALEVADVALAAAEASDDQWVLSDTLITKGTALAFTGRPREGAMLLKGALDIADEYAFSQPQLRAINNLMVVEFADGGKQVSTWVHRGLDAAIRSGNQFEIQVRAGMVAWSLTWEGRYDEALAVLDDHEVTRDETGWGWGVPGPYIAWARGETKDTTAIQAAIDAVSVESSDQQTVAAVKQATADLAVIDGRFEDAHALAMDIPVGLSPTAAETALTAALRLRDRDRFEAAAAHADDFRFRGARVQRYKLEVDTGRALLAGSIPDAVAGFLALVDHLEEYGLPIEHHGTQVLFAALVGLDIPEAREAAEAAYEWILDSGSYGYLEAWKDGLPPHAVEATG
jgi:hypothetical protein